MAVDRYATRKLPQRLTPSGWLSLLPPRTPHEALDGNATADVVVIGAGFAGLAAARRLHLIDPGLHIMVLEALSVGEGAAGRNSGFVIDLPHDVSSESYGSDSANKARQEIMLNRSAIALARGMAEEHRWSSDIFDACGKYSLAMGDSGDHHLADYARQLTNLAEPHRLLDRSETLAVTGTPAFSSALFTPGTIMIQPAAYVRAFADALAARLRLHEQTPVTSFERVSGGWRITTPKASVTAGKIIVAANGHAESFGLLSGKLLHIFTYASLSQPFDPARLPGTRRWAATPAHPMGTSVRRVTGPDGDRVLIRARYTYHPSLEISDGDVDSAGRLHDRKFAARFPMLKGVPMASRWSGAMALTWNAVPAFAEVEPGLIVACGCNGVGATKATTLGIAAADLITGQTTDVLQAVREAPPPKLLPPQPFTTMGVKASLAWRHWRAGAE